MAELRPKSGSECVLPQRQEDLYSEARNVLLLQKQDSITSFVKCAPIWTGLVNYSYMFLFEYSDVATS